MKTIPKRSSAASRSLPAPIVITGGGGMLAYDLAETLGGALPAHDLHVLDRARLDITRAEQVARLRELQPAVVINSAAYTNVDGAETEREKAYAINVTGAANLSETCRAIGARLVHFSTDQVFDGEGERPRSESDETHPCNYYAETKLLGERECLRDQHALVLRVQWLYGARKDRFTPLRNKEVFTPFADQYGAPTWTRDIARILVELLARGAAGLFHYAYDDYASWAEVFQFVKDELKLATRLEPKLTAEVMLPARRPRFSVMSNRKLVGFLGVEGMGSWKEPLREFLQSRV